jgi:hypothetical protein
MEPDLAAPRSRRALLAAAAAAGGALVAQAALPLTAAAHDADDVALDVDNPSTATTSITDSTAANTAFAAHANGAADVNGVGGSGLEGTSAAGAGVFAWSITAPVIADLSVLAYTGIYGFSPENPDPTFAAAGVWGDSADIGVYGSGTLGVGGVGYIGVEGDSDGEPGSVGVLGFAADTNQYGLWSEGKVHFSRSGRLAMSSGKASKSVTLPGATGGSKIFAILSTSETGRWVRAVVPAAGKFTVYLNTTLSTAAVVSWFALD